MNNEEDYMSAKMQVTGGASGIAQSNNTVHPVRGHARLYDSVDGLNGVLSRLEDLKNHIGIPSEPVKAGGVEPSVDKTLVNSLTYLPDEIDLRVKHILSLIQEIHEALN